MTKKRKSISRISRDERLRGRAEKVAYELYQNQLLLKRQGDALKDWTAAEEIVQNPLKAVLFAINRAFIKLEKRTWEPLLAWSSNQALLSLLGLIGNAGIIIAVLTYVGSEKQRRETEVLNAWQTITSAHGQTGSGGRIQALEFLNASPGANWRRRFPWFCTPHPLCTWPVESLDAVNLAVDSDNNSLPAEQSKSYGGDRTIESPARVYLAGIQLPGANLFRANLERADLRDANLEGADLRDANLEGTSLWNTNLEGAYLYGANLEGTRLWNANLEGAILSWANLEGADLNGANLEGAYLNSVNLERADLNGANLEGTSLWNANLEEADLNGANLEGAYLNSVNLEGADLNGANLEGNSLWNANLEGANLFEANLEGASLWRANLEGAYLRDINLEGAYLRDTNLEGAYLNGANLEGADLRDANLKGADLLDANLEGAKNLTKDLLTQAKFCRTNLSEGIPLNPNRDCKEMGIDPETGDRISEPDN